MGKKQRSYVPLLLAIPLLFWIHCSHAPIEITQPEQTGDGWETGTLASVGLDQAPFADLLRKIDAEDYGEVHSVVVIKNNRLVFERYWPGHDFCIGCRDYLGADTDFDRGTRHNTHSATKSFVSALVGIAIDRGLIRSTADVVFAYLPESYAQWRSQGREKITVEHCLMMASGLQWNEWDTQVTAGANDLMIFNGSSDPIAYLLSKPLVTEPGTRFYYNGGTVDLLGVLIKTASGQSVQSFSAQHLFAPLGITNYHWMVLQPSGITCCHGDIHITPRDMAKFGQLFLNEGIWNGIQVVSKEWVERSTQNHITPPVSSVDGYGYLWWLSHLRGSSQTVRSFKAWGWGGQQIFVLKDLAMVVVFTGANYVSSEPCDDIMQRFILPAAGM